MHLVLTCGLLLVRGWNWGQDIPQTDFLSINCIFLYAQCIYSLTALKVLLGIVLMGKASEYQYTNQVTNHTSPKQTKQTSMTSLSENISGRARSSSVDLPGTISEPNMAANRQQTTRQGSKTTTKSKSLSEIERFTLCSNRIV